jgi:hypothetical protein
MTGNSLLTQPKGCQHEAGKITLWMIYDDGYSGHQTKGPGTVRYAAAPKGDGEAVVN